MAMESSRLRVVVNAVAALVVCAAAPLAWADDTLEPPDLERGAALWGKCQACHTVDRDARNLVGPRLWGVFGRVAGSVADYRYSPTMKASGVVWTDDTLNSYLAATQDFMPGSKMYGGLAIPQDRVDLLAWLRAKSGATEPRP
jgi:cytochrome c